VLSLLGDLHAKGLTLVIVTHDERIATTAHRLISVRGGAFVDETRSASRPVQVPDPHSGRHGLRGLLRSSFGRRYRFAI
jgi:ABC-type polar amino acid transport system ATPase subunit